MGLFKSEKHLIKRTFILSEGDRVLKNISLESRNLKVVRKFRRMLPLSFLGERSESILEETSQNTARRLFLAARHSMAGMQVEETVVFQM